MFRLVFGMALLLVCAAIVAAHFDCWTAAVLALLLALVLSVGGFLRWLSLIPVGFWTGFFGALVMTLQAVQIASWA